MSQPPGFINKLRAAVPGLKDVRLRSTKRRRPILPDRTIHYGDQILPLPAQLDAGWNWLKATSPTAGLAVKYDSEDPGSVVIGKVYSLDCDRIQSCLIEKQSENSDLGART